MPPRRSAATGFTLLELLIAIAIFAIVGMLAMSGFNQLVSHRDRAAETMARTRSIQRAVTRIALDVAQLEPRPIRDATAAVRNPALYAASSGSTGYVVEFTRAGWSNPAGLSRATLQRVGYRLTDGTLYRDYWPVLDRTLNTPPVKAALLDRVTKLTLRYLNRNKQWVTSWPDPNTGGSSAVRERSLPIAIEVTLTLADWGEIKRVIEVGSG